MSKKKWKPSNDNHVIDNFLFVTVMHLQSSVQFSGNSVGKKRFGKAAH